MAVWLLTWNPKSGSADGLRDDATKVQKGRKVRWTWSCGVNKSIRTGDRLFLIRLGEEPRGIIASAWATSAVWPGRAWSGKSNRRRSLYVGLIWDGLLNPEQAPLTVSKLKRVGKMYWTPRASGVGIPPEIASNLEPAWAKHYRRISKRPFVGGACITVGSGPDAESEAFEGTALRRFVLHRKRENRLRMEKITQAQQRGQLRCEVPRCGFDFEKVYGSLGVGFAEVHHRHGLARSGPTKTKLSDLAIVCANCHRMIHRNGKCRRLEDLISRRVRR